MGNQSDYNKRGKRLNNMTLDGIFEYLKTYEMISEVPREAKEIKIKSCSKLLMKMINLI